MFQVLEPHTVTVLTTDKCTAECRHCCQNSSPSRENRLSYEQMESALSQLFQHYRMKVVVFAGGEPTLLGKDLLKAIRFCKQNAVSTRIVTNAYWAHSPEAALAKCHELRDAGLDELNISMDDYHEPYISFELVKTAYHAARQVDFRAIVIANCGGPQSVLSADFLEKEFGMEGVQIQRRFDVEGKSRCYEKTAENGQLTVLSNGNVQRLGRGAELIDENETFDDSYEPLLDRIGGCQHAVRSATISPGNHLISCCGFELHGNPILDFGDLSKHGVAELISRADNDLIVNMIGMIGPPRLMSLLKQLCPDEVSFPRKRYQSFCEVCQDLVGIEKNRQALYKYQGSFAPTILALRELLAEKYEKTLGHGLPVNVHVSPMKILVSRPDTDQVAMWPVPESEATPPQIP